MTVTPATIAIALGKAEPTAGSATYQQWDMWITDATMLIETRQLALDYYESDATALDYVIREAVVAHAKKPDDATEVTISVDDGSTSRRYESGVGRVTILDAWWTLLGLEEVEAATESGAYAITLLSSVAAVTDEDLGW